MKIKKICFILSICLVMLVTCTATGCVATDVAEMTGTKYIDFKQSDPNVATIYKSISVKFIGSHFFFSCEFADNPYFTNKRDGKVGQYTITYTSIKTDYYKAEIEKYNNELKGYVRIAESNYYIGFEVTEGILTFQTIIEGKSVIDGSYTITELEMVFTDTGSERPPVDETTEHFTHEKIENAYGKAGYYTDVEDMITDETMREQIESLKHLYSQLGYKLSYIGKDVTSSTNMELYMLIETKTADEAQTLYEQYKATYKTAVSGNNLIISLVLTNDRQNFAPFYEITGTQPPEDPDNPDNPDIPVEPSAHEKIERAYLDAGYLTNVEEVITDEATHQQIENLKNIYSQLGYKLEYIGKNVNDALNMELYMLIETKTADEAQEINAQFTEPYKTAVSGKNFIVSLVFTNNLQNFAPFYQATT